MTVHKCKSIFMSMLQRAFRQHSSSLDPCELSGLERMESIQDIQTVDTNFQVVVTYVQSIEHRCLWLLFFLLEWVCLLHSCTVFSNQVLQSKIHLWICEKCLMLWCCWLDKRTGVHRGFYENRFYRTSYASAVLGVVILSVHPSVTRVLCD